MCNSTRLCANEECQTCFEKSFASHEKSEFWSEKNGDVKPRQVFKSSGIKYWFDCCHQFKTSLNSITGMQSCLCPYCAKKRLCENEECQTCFEKSFDSHEKSKYWSDKNSDVKPRHVFKSSGKKYWFNCNCGHQFESSLSKSSKTLTYLLEILLKSTSICLFLSKTDFDNSLKCIKVASTLVVNSETC